jgi:hypothetical protein
MTAAALEQSAGRAVPVPGAAGDDGAPVLAPAGAPSSSLASLKHERGELRKQLYRLQKARAELDGPSLELQDLAAEAEHHERESMAAISAWISSGCEGHRPLPNAAMASSLIRRHEAATAAARANSYRLTMRP